MGGYFDQGSIVRFWKGQLNRRLCFGFSRRVPALQLRFSEEGTLEASGIFRIAGAWPGGFGAPLFRRDGANPDPVVQEPSLAFQAPF